MRASRHDGRKVVRGVGVPSWVTLAPRALPCGRWQVWGTCARCGADAAVTATDAPQQDAELALGRFARWHERCARSEERAMLRRVEADARRERAARQVVTEGYMRGRRERR